MKKELVSLLGEDLSQSWWFIDFWGTWCKPCLEDLPEVQDYFTSVSNSPSKQINVHTFSYASRNLDKFMSKNNYDFPVTEVEDSTVEKFSVKKFPTKFLISPNGKFIKFYSINDWNTHLKNYTLSAN